MATALFFLGVDGGATQCRARLRDASGRCLGRGFGPAANIYVDFAAGIRAVTGSIEQALAEAGLESLGRERFALGLGLAGLSSAEDASRVAVALPGFARVEAVNDAVAACVGANGLSDGGLIIAGTGSAGIARVGGVSKILGGRGFWLGDDGSGARIGEAALRATLRALDGLEPMGELTRALAAHFGGDPAQMSRWAATAKPSDYGGFAPEIFAACRAGDACAERIVAEAAQAIATLARALVALGAGSIALVGGVAEPLRPYLPTDVALRLAVPRNDAVDGAILLAGGTLAAPGGPP